MKRTIIAALTALSSVVANVPAMAAPTPTHLCKIHSPRLETLMYAVTVDNQFQFSICMDEDTNQTYYSSFGNMRQGMKDGIFLRTFYSNLHDSEFKARNGVYVYTVSGEGYDYRLRVSKNGKYILNKMAISY